MVVLVLILACIYVMLTHRLAQSRASSTPSMLYAWLRWSPSAVAVFLYFVQVGLVIIGPRTQVAWLSVFDFGPQESGQLCMAPMSAETSSLLSLLSPLVFFGILLIGWIAHWLMSRLQLFRRLPRSVSYERVAYLRTAQSLVLNGYTHASSVSFSLLRCVSVGRDGQRVLAARPGISCESGDYSSLQALAILVVVLYVIGLPLAVLILMMRKREVIRSLLTGPAAAKLEATAGSVSESTQEERPTSEEPSLDVVTDSVQQFGRVFGPLFEIYTPRTFWWNVWVLVRRALFSVTVLLPSSGDSSSRVLMLGYLTMLCLVLQLRMRPFLDLLANEAEAVALILHLGIVILLAAHSGSASRSGADGSLEVGLTCLFIVPAVLLLVVILSSLVMSRLSQRAAAAVQRRLTVLQSPANQASSGHSRSSSKALPARASHAIELESP